MSGEANKTERILVWDWPVRIGHWLMAAGFIIAWLTSESETWRQLHVIAGAVVFGVVIYRILWGFVGTSHAKFANFLHHPSVVWHYLRSLLTCTPQHFTGHNPAGGWAIAILLSLALGAGLTGYAVYQDIGGDYLEEVHEFFANTMLIVVLVHLFGIAVGSWQHGENLPRAMLSGYKRGIAGEENVHARPWAAVVLLMVVMMAVWWVTQ